MDQLAPLVNPFKYWRSARRLQAPDLSFEEVHHVHGVEAGPGGIVGRPGGPIGLSSWIAAAAGRPPTAVVAGDYWGADAIFTLLQAYYSR